MQTLHTLKRLLTACFITLLPFVTNAQNMWHLKEGRDNKQYGTGVYKAYELLKNKQPSPIIVAVIDSGTDIDHEDLKEYVWKNSDELPGNNKDDDGNGYVDDLYGWNFMGGKEQDIRYEAMEETRRYQRMLLKHPDTSKITEEQKEAYKKAKRAYDRWQKMRADDLRFAEKLDKHKNNILLKTLSRSMGYEAEYTLEHMKELAENDVKHNNINSDSLRTYIVGDDPMDTTNRYYGNNHVAAPDVDHGTHTAGIIAKIADADPTHKGWLKIMTLRAVPMGDERDKDVANSIRYAVDNGAKVISMSFGKYLSPQRDYVINAIKYAQQHDVLLVHAAGNDSRRLSGDYDNNFPNCRLDSTTCANNWIEVGASSKKKNKIVAGFSNYGMTTVDLLAPGKNIYSTLPGNNFEPMSGTSMAAPVAAGIAAMIRSYYPTLTAAEVKEVLMSTVTTSKKYVPVPGKRGVVAQLWYFCNAKGVVNAEKAIAKLEENSR